MTRKARASRPTAAPPPLPSPPPPRRAFLAALLVSLCGVGVALVLVRLHSQAHAGITSFCAISETMNCDKVAASPYSVFLGLPVALWGALAYALTSTLSAWGLTSRRLHAGWPAGFLLLLAATAVAAAVGLGLVSSLVIRTWCLMCIASWSVSGALLGAAWAACRPFGAVAAVRADLAALARAPRRSAMAALAGLALVAGLMALYPRYWEHSRAAALQGQAAGAVGAGGSGPAVVAALLDPAQGVILYSDYECPFCAVSHAELKATLAQRPDLRVLKRHFPLDQACNPIITRPIHADACRYARAAICAEAQGRFGAMDDALFANQRAKRPVEALAADLGLDAAAFGACLVSPATEQRLAADIAAGMADQIKATPTYIAGGVQYSGRLPVERFAPATPAPAPAPPTGGTPGPAPKP